MTRFLIRRCAQAVLVLVLVSIIVFGLLHLLPGGPARAILGTHATPTTIAAFNKANGLDQPVPAQYWHWLTGVLSGNLGFSYQQNQTVAALLANRIPKTAFLAGVSVVLAVLIAVPLGLYQAVRRNKADDYVVTTVTFVLYSTPAFWVGLLLVDVLAVRLHVFPAEAPQGSSVSAILSQPSALVLPVLSLTLVTYAAFSRYMRSSAIDTLAQDYIRTARAKGLSERLVLWRHLLRNSLISVTTLVGLSIPLVLTGTLIIEQVFNYPGVGLEYLQSALRNDYQVMLGITVIVGVVTVVGNLLADIGYAILDPRIRY